MTPKCEICGRPLPPIDLGPGVVAQHPELAIVGDHRVACVNHVVELTEKIAAEEEAEDA